MLHWISSVMAMLLMFGIASPLLAAPATAPALPMELKLSYQNAAGRLMGQPPQMTYGQGFMMVTAKWPTTFTRKDNVFYRAWISDTSTDWASANVPPANGAWRQYAYLRPMNAGATSSARFKVDFGYRPAGLSSCPIDRAITPLPEAMPLPPGKYAFTLTVQRIGPGSATESASQPFEVTITGDAGQGAISGLSDFQIVQRRKDKSSGNVVFRLIHVPAHTRWKATLRKADQTVATASGATQTPTEVCTVTNVPVGGPYTVQIDAGPLKSEFKEIYVGDIWIVSGQSNAVGVGYEKELYRGPMPGVHGLNPKYGLLEWSPARDGFFENTMGPWVTAAQDFYTSTGVPVGLIGYAVGSESMDYFYDAESHNPIFLRPLIERYGQGAAAFLWYQGESDSFQPQRWNSYGPKLEGLVKAVRTLAKNPQMPVGIVQLARYTWWKDDHFAPVREAQRQFVMHDPHAVLFSTMPYAVNKKDRIHINSAGQAALGREIAAAWTGLEKTGQFTSPGPVLKDVKFSGADHKTILVQFDNAKGLTGRASTEEWFVTDDTHRGYHNGGGFVDIANITIADGQITIQLKNAPAGKTQVSYGYRSDVGGSLVNGQGFPAACFVKVPVE